MLAFADRYTHEFSSHWSEEEEMKHKCASGRIAAVGAEEM